MSKPDLTEIVEPKDFDISNDLLGSSLGKSEYEQIAVNLIIIAQKQEEWDWLTKQNYEDECSHSVSEGEFDIIDQFVDDYLLDCITEYNTESFKVNSNFIVKLWNFIKE